MLLATNVVVKIAQRIQQLAQDLHGINLGKRLLLLRNSRVGIGFDIIIPYHNSNPPQEVAADPSRRARP